jgi:hypothetical protein
MLGGGGGNVFGQIMMQAIGSFMRGESPQTFLKSIAGRPEMQGVNLGDLEGSARKLAQEKGVDFNSVMEQAQGIIQQYKP